VRVGDEATVQDSILFSGVRVGEGAHLRRCIIDKNVVIPAGQRIGYDPAGDAQRFTISEEGIVVVPKGYCFAGADAP
jgi:glucose-1-phosphate adenylyltransferase